MALPECTRGGNAPWIANVIRNGHSVMASTSRRFLFCPWAAAGDIFPCIALASALVESGQDVAFFSDEASAQTISREGFSCLTSPAASARGFEFFPLQEGHADALSHEVQALQSAAGEWRADVLIDTVIPFAPRLVAERTGCGHASLSAMALPVHSRDLFPYGYGFAPPRNEAERALAGHFHAMEDRRRLPAQRRWLDLRQGLASPRSPVDPWRDVPGRDLTLVAHCPEFEYPRQDLPPSVRFVGPLIWNPGTPVADPPPPLPADDRPVILISQGSVFNEDPTILRLAADALAAEDVLVLVSTFRQSPYPDLRFPANFVVRELIPQLSVLDRLSLVITHGGAGTVNCALSGGVPLVVLPLDADQFEIAARCERAGVGRRLGEPQRNAPALRAVVREVLFDPRYRQAARRFAERIQDLRAPVVAAGLLQELAEKGAA